MKAWGILRSDFLSILKTTLVLLLFWGLCSCSYFEQNDFVVSETISNEKNEIIYYDVFQTGIDNYRFEFKTINNSDTTRLFEFYLNDAVFTVMKFRFSKKTDSLIIRTNYPTNKIFAKTRKGTVVILENHN